jgi:DNA polymerase-3 subunit delta
LGFSLKLDSRQIAGFLRDPGKTRLVLLHGEDEGLIRERAQALTKLVAGALNDPFRVVEIDRDTWSQIPSEMAALSMVGGRRVVRVREIADSVLPHIAAAMKGPGGALLILEAPGLGKGKLRTFAEATQDAASIACYPEEGRALTDLIRGILAEFRVSADPETLTWLTETLAGDRSVVRGEIEKLALLCGPGGMADMEMARACTGEAAGHLGDDGILLAAAGDIQGSDAAIEAAIADGLNGIGLLRMSLMLLQRMHIARLRIEQGMSATEAVRAMRPPMFGPAAGVMAGALGLWRAATLLRALEEARQVELACKQTGSRPELLARRYLAWIARQAGGKKKEVLF